ncbi:hypothetical protein PVAND_014139 [Polypedilum vanderplanki]|uniref:rRNA adenine N(6)-methyltransferase n=1 Tax=Polypedilum vanderplanki TaxID=319348 RepID=A0A9J6CTG1_POLVA|nr:hypothetical protein PVAND_014139 [Polypedilum vanderplanki]
MLRKTERLFIFTRNFNNIYRCLSTETISETKKKVKSLKKKKSIEEKKIYKYFDKKIVQEYPEELFVKKKNNKKVDDNFYIANEKAARIIFNELVKDLPKNKLLIEINPGIGLLTQLLIDETKNDLFLFEQKEDLFHKTAEIIQKYQNRKISLRQCDFTTLWKMGFLDKQDNGNRVEEVFNKIQPKKFEDETVARLFACIWSLSFMKDLITSVVFQNGFSSVGRIEMFLCLPPPVFLTVACSPSIGYFLYRSSAVLFQLLFEYEFITKIERKGFLPWKVKPKESKRLGKFLMTDFDYMYFIRVVPRRDLFKYVQLQDLPALWFFVRQHLTSRTKTVIPTIERWIPGSGPRLIVNSKPSIKPEILFPNNTMSSLPSYVAPCTSLSNNDFPENIHIFTQFGMLTPTQILSIFSEFKNWPEYDSCAFNNGLEKTLIKMHTKEEEEDISDDEVEENTLVETMERPKNVSEILSSLTKK